MKAIVIVIMLMVCFCFCLKQTFLRSWQQWLFALGSALFVGVMCPYAIEQSRSQIERWLADQPLMLDTSVLLSLEVLWQLSFCLLAGRLLYAERQSRSMKRIYRMLRFFPGLLILAVLFSAEVSLLYQFPGSDFDTVAWAFAAVVLVALPAISGSVSLLLPEKELRLELLFLSNVLLLILGIIATVNGTTHYKGADEVEWMALGAFLLLAILLAGVGWLCYLRGVKRYQSCHKE